MVPTLSVLLALGIGPLARAADVVVLPLADLPVPQDPAPEGPPVRALLADMDARLAPGDETTLEVRWTLRVLEDGWVDLPLVGEALALDVARIDGRPLSLVRAGDGWRRLALELPAGAHEVTVRGSVATPGAALQLPLARGVGGRVRAAGTGLDFTVADGIATEPGAWGLRPGDALDVRWAPERPAPPRPLVVRFEGAVALRGGEDGVEGAARLRYRVVDGTVSELRLRIPGGVDNLEVRGPRVDRHRVSGEQVVVTLTEPVSGRIQLDLAWRGAAPPTALGPAPVPQPLDARGRASVSLVRGDDSMLVPAPGRGLEAVPTDRVPRWGRGLVAGQPLVAYWTDTAERATLRWQRLAWEPVDAPPTLVDEARYTVVHAAHGRVHVRAAYQVRNDRNPFLRLRLPDGWQAVGVRVAGRTAEPVQAADGRWLVPLEKSVETLDGLVAFPVELMLVGDEPAWERRGLRALQTPAVDAPIAYARWEVRLPRAVQQRDIEGRATLVDAWTPRDQGLLIGRATGTTLDADDDEVVLDRGRDRGGRLARKAPPAEAEGKKAEARKAKEKSADKAVSQEYWNRAYSAYKDNRFDEAEALLEQSLAFDASNASAQSLRDNVSVLQGDAELDADQQAAANRVRELARARTNDVELAQAGKAEEAERKLRAGDVAGARAAYEELVQLTEQLAAVEQAEAVDQKSRLDAYRQQVEALGAAELGAATFAGATENESLVVSSRSVGSKGAPAKKKPASSGKRDRAPARELAPASAERRQEVEFDFEDISIEGELVKPQGALLLDRKTNAPAPAPAPPPPPPKPAPEPEPAPTPLEKDVLERVPTGRSYQAAVGVVAGAVSKPGTVTIVVPESVEEEAALDEAMGGFTFGLSGEGAGGGGLGFDGVVPAGGAAQSPPPATAAPAEGMDWYDEEPMVASDDAPMDDMDGDLRAPPRRSARVEADEIQRAAVVVASVERRRQPVRDLVRAIDLGARSKASRDPDLPPPPAEAFPSADPAPPALPVARGPRPARAHPTAAAAPPAFPQVGRTGLSPAPTSPGALGPTFPRTPAAAAAWPLRPPPPPPAPFGLDVPDGITASTLSLSLPETGTGLLLEQRLLPPDEPLRLTLKYRNRR